MKDQGSFYNKLLINQLFFAQCTCLINKINILRKALLFQEKTLKREAMAEICAKAERYVGTEGGGMDQVGRFDVKNYHLLNNITISLVSTKLFSFLLFKLFDILVKYNGLP